MRIISAQEYADQQYMPTQDYFTPDAAEFEELQKEAADLHETIDARDTAWIDRTRAAGRLPEVERKIQAYRADEKEDRQAQVQQTRQVAPHAAAPAEQQFAPPVPYFESDEEQVQQGPVEQTQLKATSGRVEEEARKAAGAASANADTVWPWRSAEVKAANARRRESAVA